MIILLYKIYLTTCVWLKKKMLQNKISLLQKRAETPKLQK